MRPFRFRAEAALQLRRREHDHALAHLARVQAALTSAAARVDEADLAIQRADQQLASTMQSATTQAQLGWYRSWRLRCCTERDQCERHRRAREADVREATANVTRTHQRVRSLERLHDHALAAWRKAADQEEMKAMDALATMRATRKEAE